LLRIGLRLRDIGDELTWLELRNFIEHADPSPRSALHRAMHPQSWWWTPEIDFYSAILMTLQSANWQRGGGKGPRPKQVTKPEDKAKTRRGADSRSEVHTRKQAMQDELVSRRRRRAV